MARQAGLQSVHSRHGSSSEFGPEVTSTLSDRRALLGLGAALRAPTAGKSGRLWPAPDGREIVGP